MFTFLAADAVGRKSLINAVFGGIEKNSFPGRVGKFAQRICDLFHDGRFQVTVTDKMQPVPKPKKATAATRPPGPDRPPTTVGDKSIPTARRFFHVHLHGKLPYVLRNGRNPSLSGILCECKNKAEAERYINDRKREAAAAAIIATQAI